MLRSMAIALFEHGSVRVTPTRAKAVQRMVEPIITYAKTSSGKEGVVRSHRYVAKHLGTDSVSSSVIKRAKQYADRSGGYTRITHLAKRREGDAASMVILEFVE